MKLVIDEKLKHRLIGIAVIISIAAIFAPAVMKKSSQNLENYTVQVKLPSKPSAPNVVLSDEKEVFKTIKVAKIQLPAVSAESQLPELAKAEMVRSDNIATHEAPVIAKPEVAVNQESIDLALNEAAKNAVVQVAANKKPATKPVPVVAARKPQPKFQPKPTAAIAVQSASKSAVQSNIYAVQLASFSQFNNAQSLVSKLKNKGYQANFKRVANRQGVVYKVYVGGSKNKTDALRLKTQLATAMQLNGFIVNTGVS